MSRRIKCVVGASGIDFFNMPSVAAAEDRRDIVILKSLADALSRLSGVEFAVAFGGSTDQSTYRWGKLHRIVLVHPLGGNFNAPPAFGALAHPLGAALPGLPTDGGLGSVDVGNHDPRAQSVDDFMFVAGASDRFVGTAQGSACERNRSGPVGRAPFPAISST